MFKMKQVQETYSSAIGFDPYHVLPAIGDQLAGDGGEQVTRGHMPEAWS